MKSHPSRRFFAPFIVFPLALLTQQRTFAAINKDTSGTDLTSGTSWVGGIAPGSGDVATWASSTALGGALSIGSAQIWQGIDIQGATTAITTSGAGTLSLGTGGINLASGGVNLSLGNSRSVGNSQSWTVGSGRTLALNGATTTFGAGTTTTLAGTGIVTFGSSNHTITGSGNLIIDGASLYNDLQAGGSSTGFSGTTTLNSGIIRISTSISMFGTGAIHLNGGAIGSFSATGRIIGTNAVNIGGSVQIGGSSGGLSTGFIRFDGATDLGGAVREITTIANGVNTNFGSGAIFTGIVSNGGLTKAGSGIMTLTNNGNTFTGATTVNAGNLAISTGSLANSSSVTLATSGAALSLGLNGTTTLNNFSGVSGTQIRTDFTISGGTGSRVMKVNQTASGTFAGTFVEGGSRPISLIKDGAATLTISGAATGYTGTTTVTAGTLAIASTGSLGNTATTVESGGTLAGAGTIGGSTTIQGIHSPGFSAGLQSFSNGLSYAATGKLAWELTDDTTVGRGTSYDALNVTGGALGISIDSTIDLAFGGAVDFSDPFWGANQEWLVVDLSGTATAADTSAFKIGALTGGANWSPSLGGFGIERKPGSNTADSVYLTWAPVPEPATTILGGLGLLALLRRRR